MQGTFCRYQVMSLKRALNLRATTVTPPLHRPVHPHAGLADRLTGESVDDGAGQRLPRVEPDLDAGRLAALLHLDGLDEAVRQVRPGDPEVGVGDVDAVDEVGVLRARGREHGYGISDPSDAVGAP